MSEKKTKDLTMEKSRQAAYIRMSPVTGDHTGESGAHISLSHHSQYLESQAEIERDGH